MQPTSFVFGKKSSSLASKPYQSDLLLNMLSCWLISIGVLLALRQLFRFEHPMIAILLHSALTILVLVLLTRRWWGIPALLSAFVFIFLLFAFIHPAILETVAGFINLLIDKFPS